MKNLTAPLAALVDVFRNPQLGRLQLSWAAVSFAMWTFAITLGVYAFEVGGAAAVGVAGFVRLLPGALASPFGGLLGDRYSRRAVLLYSSLASAVALGLASVAVAAGVDVWIVFALAGLYTVCSTPYIPAEAAWMPQLARSPQELSAANVTRSFMDNFGFLGGALISGVLLALTSIEFVFGVAAAVTVLSSVVIASMKPDRRPDYGGEEDAASVAGETVAGIRALLTDPPIRLLSACVVLLTLFEGAADVLIVIIALDLLGLAQSSVGYLNAAWAVGALAGGAALAVLINRGHLVAGLVIGSMITGASLALPGAWQVTAAAFIGLAGIGLGYTFVEVASSTLLQRIGDDEILGRVRGALETARLSAMALGSILVAVVIGLIGIQAAILATAAILPLFAILRWARLRRFEIGAPVSERHFNLLRNDRVFAPLPLETLERLTSDLVEVEVESDRNVITQGEVGDRFYLIESGRVEVVENGLHRRYQGPGESFGEIALLRDTARTATVRTTEPTVLLALDQEQFITAITGHHRTRGEADDVIDTRLTGPPDVGPRVETPPP